MKLSLGATLALMWAVGASTYCFAHTAGLGPAAPPVGCAGAALAAWLCV
jgi:hypothetical protein